MAIQREALDEAIWGETSDREIESAVIDGVTYFRQLVIGAGTPPDAVAYYNFFKGQWDGPVDGMAFEPLKFE